MKATQAATTRAIVAGATGLALTALLLHGLAVLIDRKGPLTEVLSAQRAKKKGRSGKMNMRRRLTAVMHHRPAVPSEALAMARPPQPEPPKKKKKPKPEEKLTGQVVETARPEVEKAPEDARYLGRYDMTVPVEQKSRGRRRQGKDLGKRKIDNPSRLQSPNSKSTAPTKMAGANRSARQRKMKRTASKASGQNAIVAGPARPDNGQQPRKGVGQLPGGGSPAPSQPRPSVVRGKHSDLILPATSAGNIAHNIQALAGNPGSDDALMDVHKEGETNLLNTRSFRYFGYMQRVKRAYGDAWKAAEVMASRDPSGRRYGVRDRLTIVAVRLDGEGTLLDAKVAKRSGLRFLDDEALRTVRAARMIPNPPNGLKNERGEVVFNFGFLLEMGTAKFHFYRAPN